MGKYLKLFETHSQYTAFTQTEDFILPNVSYCLDQTDIVHYNPWVEPPFFCKLTLNDGSVVELEGSGELTSAMTSDYTLVSAEIGELCTSIGDYAFHNCTNLTSVTIGSGVTTIGSGAFAGCVSLASVTIGDGVTSIGDNAFNLCINLTSVTIGSGVTSIDNRAFYCCGKLTSITSLATTAPSIQSETFQDVKTNGTLTVPSGSSGYNVWMGTGNYYLGKYGWTKVEQ